MLFLSVTFNTTILESSSGAIQRRSAENIFRQFGFLVWLSPGDAPTRNAGRIRMELAGPERLFLIWIFFRVLPRSPNAGLFQGSPSGGGAT